MHAGLDLHVQFELALNQSKNDDDQLKLYFQLAPC